MANGSQTEYDTRQYDLMADHLRKFELGKTDLASLISGLDTLLEVLEGAEKSWKDDFRSDWSTLEIVHAVALDRLEQGLAADLDATINEPKNQELIKEAVKNMWGFLTDRITGRLRQKR